jgi:hypothetical protein
MEKQSSSWQQVAVSTRRDTTATDERYTPQWVLTLVKRIMGEIDLDPCADPQKRVPAKQHFTLDDDGLEQGWAGRVFLNPPSSKTSDWVKHLCVYVHAGAVTEAVVLVPVVSLSNKGFALLMKGTATCFCLMGRNLSFLDQNYKALGEASPFPFALVYIGRNTQHFIDVTYDYGIPCLLPPPELKKRPNYCLYCGKAFLAQRKTAKYCCVTCRVEAHRKRKN